MVLLPWADKGSQVLTETPMGGPGPPLGQRDPVVVFLVFGWYFLLGAPRQRPNAKAKGQGTGLLCFPGTAFWGLQGRGQMPRPKAKVQVLLASPELPSGGHKAEAKCRFLRSSYRSSLLPLFCLLGPPYGILELGS